MDRLQISLKCEFIIQDIIITNYTHKINVQHLFYEFFGNLQNLDFLIHTRLLINYVVIQPFIISNPIFRMHPLNSSSFMSFLVIYDLLII